MCLGDAKKWYVCAIVLIVMFVDVPAGVKGRSHRISPLHTGFLHLPFVVLALIFLARRIRPLFSLVDREVEFCVLTI